jgi:hypothetical protein
MIMLVIYASSKEQVIQHKHYHHHVIEYQDSIVIDTVFSFDTSRIKQKLSYRESRGNYFVTNKYGYLGKYQIGKLVFKDLGNTHYNEYKRNIKLFTPNEQERMMNELIARNDYYLRNYKHYIGSVVNDKIITHEGMLQAAHLVGASAVKKYLTSNGTIISKDGNGTSIESYLFM